MKKLLDANGAVISTFHYDDATDNAIIQQTQDVEDIVNNNKALQTLNDGYSHSRELKRVASVPVNVFHNWVEEIGGWSVYQGMDRVAKRRFLRRKLNDSDWRAVRTSEGSF